MNLQNQLDYLPTLLDGVSVPEGLDADLVRSQIMLDCGLLTPLYSEPETMKAAITHWFLAHAWNLEHMVKLIEKDYDPLENYDRIENWTEDNTEKHSGNDRRDITEQLSNADTTKRSVTGDLVTKNDVSPYNSSTYTPSTETTVSDGQTITNKTDYGRTSKTVDDLAYGKNINDLKKREGRAHGNIGVTTSQQMAESEISLMSAFNIYEWIAKEFCSDLMILVY